MNCLLASDIWPTIKKLTRKARRVQAAIAYFTDVSNLTLRKGDLLIVDASESTIKSGGTDAHLLRRLGREGVRICGQPDLHAKVLVIDQKAVIGSANASVSSSGLYEAAILTTDPAVVSQARSFIHQLAKKSKHLIGADLDALCKIKVVRAAGCGGARKKTGRITAQGDRIWIVNAEDSDPKEFQEEADAVKKVENELKANYPSADPYWIRIEGNKKVRKQAKEGDRFVVVSTKKGKKPPYAVSPPATVLRKQPRKLWTRFYYDPELEAPRRNLKWKTFKELYNKLGRNRKVTPDIMVRLSVKDGTRLFTTWPSRRQQTDARNAKNHSMGEVQRS